MMLYLRLSWRNIWRHKRRTIIIVLAMSLTLALMMFYDGLINGFTDAIYGNAVKVLGGNIQIHAQGYRAEANSNPLFPLADPLAVVKAADANPLTSAINNAGRALSGTDQNACDVNGDGSVNTAGDSNVLTGIINGAVTP